MTSEQIDSLRETLKVTRNRRKRISLLNELSRLVRQHNPPEALAAATEALELALDLKEMRGIATAHLRLSDYYRLVADIPNARLHEERCGEVLNKLPKDPDLLEQFHCSRGFLRRNTGDHANAMLAFTEALSYAERLGDRVRVAELKTYIGTIYGMLGEHLKAIDIHRDALISAMEGGDEKVISITLGNLAGECQEVDDMEGALYYNQRAAEHSRVAGELHLEAIARAKVGAVLMTMGRLDEAESSLESAIAILRARESVMALMYSIYELGAVYARQKRFDRARECFMESLEIADRIGDADNRIGPMIGLGNTYLETGDPAKALDYYRPIVEAEQTPHNFRLHCSAYECIADAFTRLGRPMEALDAYRRYIELKSQVEDAAVRRALALFDARIEAERMTREQAAGARRAEEQRREIERKERELAALALELAQKSEMISDLRRKVSELSRSSQSGSAELANALLPQISQIVDSREQWRLFEKQFTHIHPDFIRNLAARYPGLTPVEIRVCVLLKVNLSSKEIAGILCTSVRTVEGHRRFIRKKLALPAEVHLGTFLSSFG